MKKITKLIIAAIVLVVLGGVIACIGALGMGCDFSKANHMTPMYREYKIDFEVKRLWVNVSEANVYVKRCPTGEDRIEIKETDKVKYPVEINSGYGSITVESSDKRAWYEYFGIFLNQMSLTFYLSGSSFENIFVNTASGSIYVDDGIVGNEIHLRSRSGSVSFKGDSTNTLRIETTSGKISVSGSTAEDTVIDSESGEITIKNSIISSTVSVDNFSVKTTSGDIEMENVTVYCPMEVTTTSGSVEIEGMRLTTAGLTITTSSGDVELNDYVVPFTYITTSSGDVELERCDGSSFEINTVSGDVEGSLLTQKQFDCSSTSGKVKVPSSGGTGVFKVRTGSGKIILTVLQ